MKKILFLLLATLITFTNCKKQEPEGPISDDAAYGKFANSFSLALDTIDKTKPYSIINSKMQMSIINSLNNINLLATINYTGDPTIGSGVNPSTGNVVTTINNYSGPEKTVINGSYDITCYFKAGIYLKYNTLTSDYSLTYPILSDDIDYYVTTVLQNVDGTLRYNNYDYHIQITFNSYYYNGQLSSYSRSVYVNGRKLY